jgi:four helix bundle protein
MSAKSFEDLVVWRKAHAYVLDIYKITEGFPKSELFGLTSQMRRAAVSIPANIAEGFKKRGPRDKVRVLNIGQGSLEESLYYLILSNDLHYADTLSFRPDWTRSQKCSRDTFKPSSITTQRSGAPASSWLLAPMPTVVPPDPTPAGKSHARRLATILRLPNPLRWCRRRVKVV